MGLPQMMRLAQQIEDKNLAVQAQQYRLSPPISKPTSFGFSSTTRTIQAQPTPPHRPQHGVNQGFPHPKFSIPLVSKSPSNYSPNLRRLTEAEMQEQCSKGPGHCCKRNELQLISVLDDEELNGSREMANLFVAEQMPMSDNATDLIDDSSSPSLSLSSMIGLSAPHSLKICGRIGD